MASVSVELNFKDNASPSLNKIRSLVERVQNALSKTNAQHAKIRVAIDKNAKSQQRFNGYLRNAVYDSNRLFDGIRNVAGAYTLISGAKNLLNLSDTVTQTRARLGIVNELNGSLHETSQIEQAIYESAMKSRGSYLDMASIVSGLGLRAGNAFSNVGEIVQFTEVLNKMGVVSGSSANEVTNALYQINQAMGSGKFQGDEFRSVSENLPMALQAVAKYKNVSVGALKDLAKKGEITADVFKKAILSSADEIDKRFKQMPITWGQVWNVAKNVMLKVSDALLREISEITKSERFVGFAQKVSEEFQKRINLITKGFKKLKKAIAYVYDNWKSLKPIIMGVTIALVAFNLAKGTALVLGALYAKMQAVAAARTAMVAGATFTQAAAQTSLNSALLACPIFWVVGGFIILISVLLGVMTATYDWEKANIDVWGTIKNIALAVAEAVKSAWKSICNYVKPIIVEIKNTFNRVSQAIVNNWDTIRYCIAVVVGSILIFGQIVTKVIKSIIDLFIDLWDATYNLRNSISRVGSRFVSHLDKIGYVLVIVIGSIIYLGEVSVKVFSWISDRLAELLDSLSFVGDMFVDVANWFKSKWDTILYLLNIIAGTIVALGYIVKNIGQWIGDAITYIWDHLYILEFLLGCIGDLAVTVADWFCSAWKYISPAILGVTSVMGSLILILVTIGVMYLLVAGAIWVYNAAVVAILFVLKLFNIATWKLVYAKIAAAIAGWAASSPLLFWIVVIGLLIAVIAILVSWIANMCGVSLSATGMIAGAFAVLASFLWNTIVGVWNGILQFSDFLINTIISIIEFFLNAFGGGFNSFGDAVANLLGTIISWFLDLGSVVTRIIDAIFGTNWTSGLNALKSKVLSWGKSEGISVELERSNLSSKFDLNRVEYGKAWDAGYNFGEGVENAFDDPLGTIKGLGADFMKNFDGVGGKIEGYGTDFMSNFKDFTNNAGAAGSNLLGGINLNTSALNGLVKHNDGSGTPYNTDLAKALTGGYDGSNPALDKIAGDTGKIADSTASSADSLDSSNEDTKYLRELAHREAINKYTLTDLNVNMTNNNSIGSDVDLDSVANKIGGAILNLVGGTHGKRYASNYIR